ncbi:MAG: hypothetical protein ACRAVC_21045 [Trichormus sp.]
MTNKIQFHSRTQPELTYFILEYVSQILAIAATIITLDYQDERSLY